VKTFTYEFEQTRRDQIRFEYDDNASEKLWVGDLGTGTPALSLNRSGMLMLAKLMMALGDYSDTFHLHLHEDFDEDKPEVLMLALRKEQ
jgi:hypothetical protein